jgi:RNA polymerase sigma-70 factor (ECF subfamily)
VGELRVATASRIAEIYAESGDRLWWALFAYTGDREAARDAAAEAFARALRSTDVIRDPRAWIWKVAFKVATTEIRRRRMEGAERETSYEIDDRAVAVAEALRRLPSRQRAVTVLFYLEDLPTKDVARILGISSATVSVHLHRARGTLRRLLEDSDD